MSLSDYIINENLTQFKPQRINIIWPEFFKPVNNVIQWEDISKLTKEQIQIIQDAINLRHTTAKENIAHNARILIRFRKEFAEMMDNMGVNVWKRKDDDKMFAAYENIFNDIKSSNDLMTKYVTNEMSMSVQHDGVKFHESSSQVQNWYERVTQQIKDLEKKHNIKRMLLINAISFCVENGISVRNYKNDQDIIDAVNKFQCEQAIESDFPTHEIDTNIKPDAKCSSDCVVKHGEQYCSCGRKSITYGVTGGPGYFSVRCFISEEPVLGKNIFYHPNVGEPIPF